MIQYMRPEAQGPFYITEMFENGGGWNTVGPFEQMDEATATAERRIRGCHTINYTRVKKDFQTGGHWSSETVAVVTRDRAGRRPRLERTA